MRVALGARESMAEDLELAAEFAGSFCNLCDEIGIIAHKEAKSKQKDGGRNQKSSSEEHKDWAQVIGHMDVMLSNEAREVQCSASRTLAVLAESSPDAKEQMCNSPGVIQKLVNAMRIGVLEAIGATAAITKDHVGACDHAREAGAISLLASFISSTEEFVPSGGDGPSNGDVPLDAAGSPTSSPVARRPSPMVRRPSTSQIMPARGRPPLSANAEPETLSAPPSAADGEKATVQRASLLSPNAAPTEVPVASKAEVVATLRNIAKANDESRLAITRENVIPQLVRLMTSKPESNSEHAARDERIKLEEDTRKLAEGAGQMLFTLIKEGTTEMKDLIIGAIILRVQEPGTRPPEDVPELMTLLRTAAGEQLSLTEVGDDREALRRALEFGKWIKVPTTLLSEARNTFMAVREARENAEKDRNRRALLGYEADESEVVSTVITFVEKLRAAKLRATKRRADNKAAAELLQTDAPIAADAEEEDETDALPSSSVTDQVKQRPKGSGVMKKGAEKTPRMYIHTWFLLKQASMDDDHDEEDVEHHVSGGFAKLTDGEKPSKGSKAKKETQGDATARSGKARGGAGEVAGPAGEVEAIKYEYGYVTIGHAGAGRKKVQAAEESLTSQLTPVAHQLIRFSTTIADLAQRSNLAERSAERVISPALRGHLVKVIDHLALMLSSETQQVKESASTTLGVMVRCDGAFKAKIAADLRIISGLTKLMNEGVLEAVGAVESLLAGSEQACNQAREAGVRAAGTRTDPMLWRTPLVGGHLRRHLTPSPHWPDGTPKPPRSLTLRMPWMHPPTGDWHPGRVYQHGGVSALRASNIGSPAARCTRAFRGGFLVTRTHAHAHVHTA